MRSTNKVKSSFFNPIENTALTRQPVLYLLSLVRLIVKQPSPSVKPVTNQGFNIDFDSSNSSCDVKVDIDLFDIFGKLYDKFYDDLWNIPPPFVFVIL